MGCVTQNVCLVKTFLRPGKNANSCLPTTSEIPDLREEKVLGACFQDLH